jgi:hypothetical protein
MKEKPEIDSVMQIILDKLGANSRHLLVLMLYDGWTQAHSTILEELGTLQTSEEADSYMESFRSRAIAGLNEQERLLSLLKREPN